MSRGAFTCLSKLKAVAVQWLTAVSGCLRPGSLYRQVAVFMVGEGGSTVASAGRRESTRGGLLRAIIIFKRQSTEEKKTMMIMVPPFFVDDG